MTPEEAVVRQDAYAASRAARRALLLPATEARLDAAAAGKPKAIRITPALERVMLKAREGVHARTGAMAEAEDRAALGTPDMFEGAPTLPEGGLDRESVIEHGVRLGMLAYGEAHNQFRITAAGEARLAELASRRAKRAGRVAA